jgi:hypothetical protein
VSHLHDAIDKGGLSPVWRARKAFDLAAILAMMPVLKEADLLLLGALADEARRDEVGDVVRFVTVSSAVPRAFHGAHVKRGNLPGLAFLREVAIARITSEPRAQVRIDWDEAGFELAQVALGFGANEIWGALANKRGLPILEEDMKKVKGEGMVSMQALKRRELEKLLSYVGRQVIFEGEIPASTSEVLHAE